MVLDMAEVIFNNSSSQHNRDLYNFFERNQGNLVNRTHIGFRFKVVQKNEISSLRKRGISKLPAMVLANKVIIGVPDIISDLRRRAKRSKGNAAKKTDEETLQDYFKAELGDVKHDAEGRFVLPREQEPSDRVDLSSLANAEVERRAGANPINNRARPPPSLNRETHGGASYTRPTVTARPNRTQSRNDNLDLDDDPGDPMKALDDLKRMGQGSKDDMMMRQLLEKMGGDDF